MALSHMELMYKLNQREELHNFHYYLVRISKILELRRHPSTYIFLYIKKWWKNKYLLLLVLSKARSTPRLHESSRSKQDLDQDCTNFCIGRGLLLVCIKTTPNHWI